MLVIPSIFRVSRASTAENTERYWVPGGIDYRTYRVFTGFPGCQPPTTPSIAGYPRVSTAGCTEDFEGFEGINYRIYLVLPGTEGISTTEYAEYIEVFRGIHYRNSEYCRVTGIECRRYRVFPGFPGYRLPNTPSIFRVPTIPTAKYTGCYGVTGISTAENTDYSRVPVVFIDQTNIPII